MHTSIRASRTAVNLATAYADQAPDELVIPENLAELSADDLQALSAEAQEAFNAIYGDGANLTDEAMVSLASLTEGIEALAAETAQRIEAQSAREAQAAELASRVSALSANTDTDEAADADAEGEGEEDADEDADPENDDESAADTVVLAARGETRLNLSNIRRTTPAAPVKPAAPSATDVLISAGEGTGFAVGEGIDFVQVGQAIDRKLAGHNSGQYANAAGLGRQLKEQHSIVSIKREFAAGQVVTNTDRDHVESVLDFAADQSRLPGGSLVAAGGWCAPSETLYDLLELESRDGMLSLPEFGVRRGGITFTKGMSFADLYADITGFNFTEEEAIAGKYSPTGAQGANVAGSKPVYKVECPEFEEVRLNADGLIIQAGLLQMRGYPEVIARTVRGALVAHEHRMNGRLLSGIEAGSTAVNMAANQAGALAPLLSAIELQVEHYKYTHRLSRNTTLEAIFPFWVRGAVRSDLSRRLGVDLLSVPDSRIDGWFRERGVNPQFVYNWQAIDTTAAASFNAWPTTVKFALYVAGTWQRGSSEVLTLDTMYDSTLLGNNDYTALFTEEGWLLAKRGFDSRVVSVPLSADGVTHMGMEIAHNGALGDYPATAVAS